MDLVEEERKKRTQPAGYGAVVRTSKPAEPASLASVVAPGTTSVVTGAADDASRAFGAGQYGAGIGQVIRGAAALPVAGFDDTVGRGVRALGNVVSPIAAGVGNALVTAATGDAAPVFGVSDAAAAPAGARRVAAPVAPALPGTPAAIAASAGQPANPTDARLAEGMQTPVGVDASRVQLGTQQGQDVGIGGVRRFVTGGKTLYSNVENGADNAQLMSAKPGVQVAPGAAAGAYGAGVAGGSSPELYAARLAAVNRGDIDAVKASYGGAFNDSGQATPTTGNAVIDQINESVRNGKKLTARGARVLTDAVQQQQAGQNAQAQTAISAQRLGIDAAQAGSTIAEANVRTATGADTLRARRDYARAVNSGDAKAIVAAEENLRAIQGKYEKETPDLYNTTAIPGGVDPATGMPRGAGAIVTNKRTGEIKIVSADEAKGQTAAAAQGISRADYDKLPRGATYVGQDGKKYVKG